MRKRQDIVNTGSQNRLKLTSKVTYKRHCVPAGIFIKRIPHITRRLFQKDKYIEDMQGPVSLDYFL